MAGADNNLEMVNQVTANSLRKNRQNRGEQRRRIGRPPAALAEDTKARLVEQAFKHFAAYGYGGATIKAIADDADVTSGAIYYYFDSKQGLFEAVLDYAAGEGERLIESRITKDMSIRERISVLLDVLAQEALARPEATYFWQSLDIDASRYPEVADVSMHQFYRHVALYRHLMDPEMRKFTPTSDPSVLAAMTSETTFVLVELLVVALMRFPAQPKGGERLLPALRALQRIVESDVFPLATPPATATRR
jgi:AcrR family transcriptional regulator